MIKLLTFTSSQYTFNSMPRATNTTASISILSPKLKLSSITYRSMMRQSAHILKETAKTNLHLNKYYSTRVACKIQGGLKNHLANDGTGKHTHVLKKLCIQNDCESKKCPTICDDGNGVTTMGHNTHKPPIGRFTRFVSENDANGDKKAQYFVPSNTKKELTEKECQQHAKEFKMDSKQQDFINNHDDKYQ